MVFVLLESVCSLRFVRNGIAVILPYSWEYCSVKRVKYALFCVSKDYRARGVKGTRTGDELLRKLTWRCPFPRGAS